MDKYNLGNKEFRGDSEKAGDGKEDHFAGLLERDQPKLFINTFL